MDERLERKDNIRAFEYKPMSEKQQNKKKHQKHEMIKRKET